MARRSNRCEVPSPPSSASERSSAFILQIDVSLPTILCNRYLRCHGGEVLSAIIQIAVQADMVAKEWVQAEEVVENFGADENSGLLNV